MNGKMRNERHAGIVHCVVPGIGPLAVFAFMLPVTAMAASIPGSEEVRLAYIDPGAGSFVVQALIAALAGIAVTGRIYWARIKNLLGIATPDEDDEDSQLGDD